MEISVAPWVAPSPAAAGLQLVLLPAPLLRALAHGDVATARPLVPFELTEYLGNPECARLWQLRLEQVARRPADHPWVTRVVVDERAGVAVGRAGFHGAPDRAGMVEIGYATDPDFQRRGFARGALEIMLHVAREDPRVAIVRATISPTNDASLALIKSYDFTLKGEQWDDEDGLELVFESPA